MKITLNTFKNINKTSLSQNDRTNNTTKQLQNLDVNDGNNCILSKEASIALKSNIAFGGTNRPPFHNPSLNNVISRKNNTNLTPEIILTVLRQYSQRREIIVKLCKNIKKTDLKPEQKQILFGLLNHLNRPVVTNSHSEIIGKLAFIQLLLSCRQKIKEKDEENLKLIEHFLTPSFILNNTFIQNLSREIHITNKKGNVKGFKIGTMKKEIGNINEIIFGVNQWTHLPEFTVKAKPQKNLSNMYAKFDGDDKNYEVENINSLFIQYPIDEFDDYISIFTENHGNIIVNNREFRGSATLKNDGFVDLSRTDEYFPNQETGHQIGISENSDNDEDALWF